MIKIVYDGENEYMLVILPLFTLYYIKYILVAMNIINKKNRHLNQTILFTTLKKLLIPIVLQLILMTFSKIVDLLKE